MDANAFSSIQFPQFLMVLLMASPPAQLLLLSGTITLVYAAIRWIQPRLPSGVVPFVWVIAAVVMVVLLTPYLYLYSLSNSVEDTALLAKSTLLFALLVLVVYGFAMAYRRNRQRAVS